MATTVAFAALHHVLISSIWFSLLPMLAAGALCGLSLAWSYRELSGRPSPGGWLRYNLLFVGLLVLMGAVSFLVYEPVYTIPGLLSGLEPFDGLLRQAMPLSIGFGIVAGAVISVVRGRSRRAATAITTASVAVTVLLGHNAAILGMVHMTQEAVPLLAQFYGLIAAIMAGNAAVFLLLERRWLAGSGAHAAPVDVREAAPRSTPLPR